MCIVLHCRVLPLFCGVLPLVHLLVYPFVYLLPYLYLDVMLVWLTAEPVLRTDNKLSTHFIPSKSVELFVHCCGPSAQATMPEWAGKPMATQILAPNVGLMAGGQDSILTGTTLNCLVTVLANLHLRHITITIS